MEMQAQLELKSKWVSDALERIGQLKDIQIEPVIPSPIPYSYRRHISLALLPQKESYQAIYTGHIHGEFILPSVCPIFCNEDNPILSQVHNIAQQLSAKGHEQGRLIIMKQGESRYYLEFHFKQMPSNAEEVLKQALHGEQNLTGALCQAPGKILKWGNPISNLDMGPYKIAYSSGAFIQNHPEQSAAIYRAIESIAQKTNPRNVLDLYCGIGIASILLSAHCNTVTGVELNPEGVRLARQNCLSNGINNVWIRQGDVEQELSKPFIGNRDWVLLNPPRTGAGEEVVKRLLQLRPRHIIYVSCMPPTLARDIKPLCQQGYSVAHCQPYDMFPQTTHVETLLHLTLH